MTARLHLCRPEAMVRLEPMVAACHAEMGIESDAAGREAALAPLLDGAPHGAVYLIGPARAPVGYLVVTFSWSVALGGLDARLDELWIRSAVRRRGMASEAVSALAATLAGAGLRALGLAAVPDGPAARLAARLGFRVCDRSVMMRRALG